MKILIVEDEKRLSDSILNYFKSEKYICDVASTFTQASERIFLYEYDCIVLDINLPDGSGFELISEIKKKNPETGIIIVSARDALQDKLSGLKLGSDDYLTKPFHLSELNARIQSILRRKKFTGENTIRLNELFIDLDSRKVSVGGFVISLTPKEYDLLVYLISNKNKLLSKNSISEYLWGDTMDMASSYDYIYTHMRNLRRKLLDAGCFDYIHTVYGIGYNFKVDEAS